MLSAPYTPDEDARSELLRALHLLDTPPEEAFDRVARLAARALDAPIALISLIDRERQWFKARVGLEVAETPRDLAFCSHAILDSQPLLVADATQDVRFADNPLVTGAPGIRMYAGVPIVSSGGIALGTLCVIDSVPRTLTAADVNTLQDLAAIIRREIIHREATHLSQAIFQHSHRAVEDSEARFQATFEQAAVGIALVAIDGRWLQVNHKLCEIGGYSADELLNLNFQDITHPEDVDIDVSLVQQALKGLIDNYSIEKRYIRRDGSVVWVNLSVALRRDSNGKPLHFIAAIEDIQARKEAEATVQALHQDLEHRVVERTRQLQISNERLQLALERQRLSEQSLRHSRAQIHAIADNLPVQIAHVDSGLVFQFANEAYRSGFGLEPETLVGRAMPDVFGAALMQQLQPRVDTVLAGTRIDFEIEFNRHDRTEYWSVTYIPDVADVSNSGFYIMSQDVTGHRQLEMALERDATEDALTGLPNRRALLQRLPEAIARADRSGYPVGVLFLDLDNFKGINDRYGHDAGDQLLKEFAGRLRQCVRETDTVARLAGDEFVIVFEALKNGMADAETLAEKIVELMGEAFALNGEHHLVGTSVGIYMHEPHVAITPEQALAAADRAMYQAKRAGKNRICLARAS